MYGRRAKKRREKGNSGSCMRRIERWFGNVGVGRGRGAESPRRRLRRNLRSGSGPGGGSGVGRVRGLEWKS